MLQRSSLDAASAELLLARMQASVDALCITRETDWLANSASWHVA